MIHDIIKRFDFNEAVITLNIIFTPGHKDRYEILGDVDAYDRVHPSGTDNESSGGDTLLPCMLSTYALESLGHTKNLQ